MQPLPSWSANAFIAFKAHNLSYTPPNPIKGAHSHYSKRRWTHSICCTRTLPQRSIPLLHWRSSAITTTIRWLKTLGRPSTKAISFLLSPWLRRGFLARPSTWIFIDYMIFLWSFLSKDLRIKTCQRIKSIHVVIRGTSKKPIHGLCETPTPNFQDLFVDWFSKWD